ncbi:hypothetical protein [Streptococcus marmotae]|uniref:hypothetical protein n=1 Tax=Streptococcus marmotae TaxID=1825069 RepID=UPI000B227DDD|nr:hypothetical protein [Streptococcus marmotae]
MRKKMLIVSQILLMSMVLSACSKNDSTSTKASQPVSSVMNTSSSSTEQTTGQDFQRIGSDEYGYIAIPKNWIRFTDVDGSDSIQYTDGSGYNIVTLNGYTREKANLDADEEFTAKAMADRIASVWHEHPDVEEIWGDMREVAGNEAFQVTVVLKSKQQIVTWAFKKDERVYMIAYEGSKESLEQFTPYIEKTWQASKE